MKKLPVLQEEVPTTNPPLPELHESVLDWEELDCVLADLDDFAVIGRVLGRASDGRELMLNRVDDARDRFVRGELSALQIEYEFADEAWVDTFLREATGARLVRMAESAHQEAQGC